MNESEARAWLEKLAAEKPRRTSTSPVHYFDNDVDTWTSEAETALRSVFPADHTVLRRWADAARDFDARDRSTVQGQYQRVERLYAVFATGKKLVDEGRLAGLIEGVRAETVGELLDQAETLCAAHHELAGAVVAGGALETHLKHLCQQTGLAWSGSGSISVYDGVIAQARNAGQAQAYSATDTALIRGWGALRNSAAHTPTAFTTSQAEVKLMIDGIRQFIARTT